MPTNKVNAAELSNRLLASFRSVVAGKKQGNAPAVCEKQSVTAVFEDKRELHPYLKEVNGGKSFQLKTDHGNVVAEVAMLEGLCENLRKAPGDAIVFHMSGRNDFATWIKDAVGDWWLGSKVEKVRLKSPEETRSELIGIMEERIYRLKKQ